MRRLLAEFCLEYSLSSQAQISGFQFLPDIWHIPPCTSIEIGFCVLELEKRSPLRQCIIAVDLLSGPDYN